jgi:type VI protein secretion system component VasF
MMSDIDQKSEPKQKDENMKSGPDEMQVEDRQDADEQEEDLYPLRKPSEDPRWAVRTVWIWVSFAVASLLFILIMLFFGIFYD